MSIQSIRVIDAPHQAWQNNYMVLNAAAHHIIDIVTIDSLNSEQLKAAAYVANRAIINMLEISRAANNDPNDPKAID